MARGDEKLMRARKVIAVASFALALCLCSCKSKENIPIEEHYGDGEGAVSFDITNITGSSGDVSTTWDATYKSAGHVAKFKIVLEKPDRFIPAPIRWSFGKGKFVAVPESDGTALIAELKKQLEAKRIPARFSRVQELPFEYVVLGQNQPRAAGSRVKWTTMKVFLGDDEGEVFLNLNLTQCKGEFSIKDPDYGDFVVAQLARVL